MRDIYAQDIILASILVEAGIPRRSYDPTTIEVRRDEKGNRRESWKFWFDCTDQTHYETAHVFLDAYYKAKNWEEFALPRDHVLYRIKAAFEIRNQLIDEGKKMATPQVCKELPDGRTLVMPENASRELRDKIKSVL